MEFDSHNTDAGASIDAGQQLATARQEVQTLAEGGIPFTIGLDGHPVSLEHLLPFPISHCGTVALDDVDSFIEYLNKYKQAGTLVFVKTSLTGGAFTAKLDYPEPGKATWGKHIATLALVPTPDWNAWTAVNAKWQTQEQFCEFVEKQRHVFSDPRAADMLEISRSIEAKKEGQFKSGLRLPNGDRTLLWESNTTATAGNGKLEIPEEITIELSPFEGGSSVLIRAFLRYRIEGGAVRFQVEMQRAEEIVRAAVKDARNTIADKTTLPVLNGSVSRGE